MEKRGFTACITTNYILYRDIHDLINNSITFANAGNAE